MTRTIRAQSLALALALPLALSMTTAPCRAQTAARRTAPAGEVTGLEMGIDGSLAVAPGGDLRWYVTVYEVVRRRSLRPAPGARLVVSSSFSRGAPLAEVTADARGRATLALTAPDDLDGRPTLRVEATSPRGVRRVFSVTLTVEAQHRLTLLTDRQRVPPGGSVLAFGQVRGTADGAPREGVPVTISGLDEPVETDAHGVFVARVRAPEDGSLSVTARTEHALARRQVRVEAASDEPLWVQAVTEPAVAAPGARIEVDVVVRTPRGAAVAGARVRWRDEDEEGTSVTTDAEGRARVPWEVSRAPGEPVRTIDRILTITAPRLGSVDHLVPLVVSRVPAQLAWAVSGGALVPGLAGRIFVRAVRPDGAPAAGVELTLEAPRLGAPRRATTDRDGVATFDGTPGERAVDDECGGQTAMAATVALGAHRERLCLPIDPDATLAVRATVEGRAARVEILRRTAVAPAPVEVTALAFEPDGDPRDGSAPSGRAPTELLAATLATEGRLGAWRPVAMTVAAPGESVASLELPAGTRGEIWLRARPILERGGTARGGAALAWVDAPAAGLELRADASGGRVSPGAGSDVIVAFEASAADLLRRAVAALQGPVGAAIDEGRSSAYVEGVLAALTPSDDAASAAWRGGQLVSLPLPASPVAHGLLRDPWRTQSRFIRGRVGRLMRAVEEYVEAALPGRLEDVAVREGGAWRFNRALLDAALVEADLANEAAAALDGEPLDIEAMTRLDPSFTYDRVARRVTRAHLFAANVMLRDLVRERQLDVPWSRRGEVPLLVPGLIEAASSGEASFSRWPEAATLYDGWGTPLALRPVRGRARFAFLSPVDGWELVSAGPDQRLGTADDLADPFARVLPAGSIYADAVGEDVLLARLDGTLLDRATVASLAELLNVYVEDEVDGPIARRAGWWDAPAPAPARVDGAPVTPIDDAIGGRGPEVAWELPAARRSYAVTALRFGDAGLRTDRATLVAGAPWVADLELPHALRVGERLSVPLRLVRLADAPRPTVTVETRGRAVDARLEGDRLVLDAARAGLTDVTVRVRIDDRTTSTFAERLRVVPDGELRARSAATWSEGEARLAVHTPGDATPWRGRLSLTGPRAWPRGETGDRARADHPALLAWSRAMVDQPVAPTLLAEAEPGDPLTTACAIVAWARDEQRAEAVTPATERLRRALPEELEARAAVLTALSSSASLDPEGGADPMAALVAELRQDGWRTLTRASDRPAVMARMAAGLLLADRADAAGRLLLERATARLEADGAGRRWVPGDDTRTGDSWIGTLALAIAARQVGDDALAEELARSGAARLDALAEQGGEGLFWALAAGVYGVFGVDAPSEATVTINGAAQRVVLDHGYAELPLPRDADVTVRAEGALVASAESRYLAPAAPGEAGPLRARVEGTAGREGGRSGLELVVTNATERAVSGPVVDVQLPGAARCDEDCQRALRGAPEVRGVDAPDLAGVIRVHLEPLSAEAVVHVPLAFRWIASGRTRGLRLTAYALDDPSATSVTPPRALTVPEAP